MATTFAVPARPSAMTGVDGNKQRRDTEGIDSGLARQQGRAWIETTQRRIAYTALRRLARQQGRAWIETSWTADLGNPCQGSPVSNDGRGLKLDADGRLTYGAWARPSAMTGVDGNKWKIAPAKQSAWLARQQGRAWIETIGQRLLPLGLSARPSAMTGVDGNALAYARARDAGWLARQQGRAWIETTYSASCGRTWRWLARQQGRAWIETPWPSAITLASTWLARQQGRAWIETRQIRMIGTRRTGLARQQGRAWIETLSSRPSSWPSIGSPVSNDGRGLKLSK